MSVIAFYIIGAIILTGALLAVTSAKIFRSAIWLLLSLTGIAAFYFWLDLQFLAAVQIVVYIGGIVVLIIFSIFLTEHTGANLPSPFAGRKAISFLLAVGGFALICYVISQTSFQISTRELDAGISTIGKNMLSTEAGGYALPFEAISVLLLAAMIGCIAIAIRKTQGS